MNQNVGELFELYLARSDLRPASIRFKKMSLKYFIEWFGDMPPGGCNLAIAEDYKTLLAKGRSKRSANGYLSNFKPFWTWLFRHGRISSNPFDGIRLYRITELKRETFKSGELSRMLKVASRLWRLRICQGLLGMRRGEMLNVQVCDINLSSPHPHILLCPKKATKDTWPWGLKDHSIRYVALPERMYFDDIVIRLHDDILGRIEEIRCTYVNIEQKYYEKLIRWQQEETLTDIHTADPTGNFQRMFRTLQKRAGIYPPRRYHELRAAFITKMIDYSDLSRAADAAGHSSVQTTKCYHRFSEMSLVADMGKMAEKCYQSNVP